MSDTFPTASTYKAQFTINNSDGQPLNLQTADIKFVVVLGYGTDEILYEKADTDDSMTVEPDNETGTVVIEIPAEELTWDGTVFEELRVNVGGVNAVAIRRKVEFDDVTTKP